MKRYNKLSSAIRIAMLSAAGAALLPATTFAQDSNDEAIEEVFVAGSHIKRSSDYQDGSHIVGIDRATIDAIGSLTVADVLRSSPLNAYGSFSERSGSSSQSNANINLRGLGAERTLVTVDGRRLTGSPNQGASITNINMIPMAAVERVDILADGASAVYGSDAVAGVVNMQMRKNFDGMEFTIRGGERDRDDGGEFAMSLLGGITGEKGNITFAIETSDRDPIWDRDREYTSPWARDTNGNGVIDAYVDTDGYSIYGASIAIYDPNTGYDRIQAANGCSAGNGFLGVVDSDIDWGADTNLNENTYCMFGYADISANKAELKKKSAYVSTNYEINDYIELYSSTIVSRVESFGRFAPPAAAWNDMPADYAAVPFDIDALMANGTITEDFELTGYYRWTNIGPRDNFVTDTQIDSTVGFRGDITDSVSYEAYVQKSTYDVKEFGYYYLSYPGLDYVLNNGIDPFSEEGAGAMSATTTNDNETDMLKYYGHMQFSLGSLAGGEILALAGVEHFEVDYKNLYDRASEAGFVGGSSGNSSAGDRTVTAVFGEAVLPFTDNIEVSAALRYDSYSDFGSAVSPAISASWAIVDSLTLRAKWGMGFRAPGLDQLFGPETFSAESASDQYTCGLNDITPQDCGTAQYDTYFTTNPDLDAEESNSLSMGVKWEAADSLILDLSYWSINIDNVITQPTTQSVFYAEAAGFTFNPASGTYVDRTGGGRADVYSAFVNQGELAASGLDFQINYVQDTAIGTFSADALVTYSLSYEQAAYFGGPTQETAGYNLQPEIKAQTVFGWNLNQHSVHWTINYLGESTEQDFIAFDSSGNAFLDTSPEKLDSWVTMNLSYAFNAGSIGAFKLGVRNLTDEDPILDRTEKFDTTHYDLYDQTGRMMFAEYKIAF